MMFSARVTFGAWVLLATLVSGRASARVRVTFGDLQRARGLIACAWLSLVAFASGCAWSRAQPTFLVQLTHVARAHQTPDARLRAERVTLWAGISMALERSALTQADAPERAGPRFARDELGNDSLDAVRPQGVAIEPELGGCARPDDALCAWARSAEQDALVVALQHVELAP